MSAAGEEEAATTRRPPKQGAGARRAVPAEQIKQQQERAMPNIHQRLHAAMGEVDYIQKEKRQGMRYSIVSHDAVTAKVRPILHRHGVIYYPVHVAMTQVGNRTEGQITVRFANVDEPGDHIDVPSAGYGIDDQDKGPGKAISYAVKYALLKTLGLETGDDPDQEQEQEFRDPVVETFAELVRTAASIDEIDKLVAANRDVLVGMHRTNPVKSLALKTTIEKRKKELAQ